MCHINIMYGHFICNRHEAGYFAYWEIRFIWHTAASLASFNVHACICVHSQSTAYHILSVSFHLVEYMTTSITSCLRGQCNWRSFRVRYYFFFFFFFFAVVYSACFNQGLSRSIFSNVQDIFQQVYFTLRF